MDLGPRSRRPCSASKSSVQNDLRKCEDRGLRDFQRVAVGHFNRDVRRVTHASSKLKEGALARDQSLGWTILDSQKPDGVDVNSTKSSTYSD